MLVAGCFVRAVLSPEVVGGGGFLFGRVVLAMVSLSVLAKKKLWTIVPRLGGNGKNEMRIWVLWDWGSLDQVQSFGDSSGYGHCWTHHDQEFLASFNGRKLLRAGKMLS